MLYLWIFGNNIEDRLGPVRFLGFYLLAGIAATVGAGPRWRPSVDVPNLGASGAIAGVLGAYLLLFPRARVLTAVIIFFFIELVRIPAVIVIGLWFVLQLASGHRLARAGRRAQGGVAYFAHVGGFAAGIAAGAAAASSTTGRAGRASSAGARPLARLAVDLGEQRRRRRSTEAS